MQLFFDHILCQQSDKDLNFTLVSAYFDKDEEAYALTNGWVPFTSWYSYTSDFSKLSYEKEKIIWVQVRSSRIDVNKWSLNKQQRRLLKNNIITVFEEDTLSLNFEKIYEIYLKYCEYKNFGDVKPYIQFVKRYKNNSLKFLCYYDQSELVAFCMVEFLGNSLYSHQFCWNYHNPKLSLGVFSQIQEVELAKSKGLGHVYIGAVAELYGLYKTKNEGFEYWDGRQWLEADDALNIMIEKDTNLKTLEELYDFTLDYIKIKKL